MRIVFFGNGTPAVKALKFLLEAEQEVVALVVHPPGRGKMDEVLVEDSGLPPDRVFLGSELRNPGVIERISSLDPEVGVSVYFGYILRRELLDVFPGGCVNLHPALLPFNRGAYPNVWSIVDRTPAGVTLHFMDDGVDTGPIIDQREVPVFPWDTGVDLYQRLQRAGLELLRDAWSRFVSGELKPKPQTASGTMHRMRDVETIDEIELDREYRAGHLLNILRARTFPPHEGAYFVIDGRKVYVSVALCPEEETRED